MTYKTEIFNRNGDKDLYYDELIEEIINIYGVKNAISEKKLNEILNILLSDEEKNIAELIDINDNDKINWIYNTKSGKCRIEFDK